MKLFNSFERTCTHCGGNNLKSEMKKLQGYGNPVFEETFVCTCGAESKKSTVLRKKDKIPAKFKNIT